MYKGVSAHRGNMSVFPENTMLAFESAVALQCDFIELDVQFTADKKIVVTHDASAKRVTGMNVQIAGTNYSLLTELDFGEAFRKATNQTISQIPFQKLPLLSEVLELTRNTSTRISVQPKCNGIVKSVFELAADMNMLNNIGFNDTNCEYLVEARNISKSIPLFWDRPPHTDFSTDIYLATQFNFQTLMYEWQGLNEEKIATLKQNGITVGASVINDEASMRAHLAMGVERFYTDYPELLISILKQQ